MSYYSSGGDTAWNSYLGTCSRCKKFGSIGGVSDLCSECRMEDALKRKGRKK